MGNIKYKDEMDLIYMLIDLTGIRKSREQEVHPKNIHVWFGFN
jgi:hypothetical protein